MEVFLTKKINLLPLNILHILLKKTTKQRGKERQILSDFYIPTRSMQTQPSRSTRDDGNLALEGEDGAKVLELDLFFGGHFCDFPFFFNS